MDKKQILDELGQLNETMSLKHINFAKRYYKNGGNATKAAVTVGYSKHSAYSTGSRLLKDANVKRYIRLLCDLSVLDLTKVTRREIKELYLTIKNRKLPIYDRIKATKRLIRYIQY